MGIYTCSVCGGSSFRADRALAGRLVCSSCGSPENSRRSFKFQSRTNLNRSNKKVIFFAIIIMMIILIVYI